MKTKVKQENKVVVGKTNAPLFMLIDTYGTLKQQIKNLEIEEAALKKQFENLETGKYEGKKFTLTVTEYTNITEIDKKEILKKLGVKRFLEVANISIEKLKEYLPPIEIEQCIKATSTVRRYTVKEKTNGSS